MAPWWLGTLSSLNFRIVDVRQHLTQIAHVKLLSAARAFHEVIDLGFGNAIGIVVFHDRTFLWFQAKLYAFAGHVFDAIGTAEKLCGFLDRSAGLDRGLEVIDIQLRPVRSVVNFHHRSSRRPLKNGCRTFPSTDFARYSISASNDGSTHMPRCSAITSGKARHA
jgi:hypothetical protein